MGQADPRSSGGARSRSDAGAEPFHRLAEASPDGYLIFRSLRDAEGRITDFECLYANAAAATMLGYPLRELPGTRLLAGIVRGHNERVYRQCAAVVESGRPWKGHFRYPVGSGDQWFRTTLVRLDDGFAVTFSDVTTAARAERERARKVSLLESVHEGIFGVDPAGRCTFINRAAAEMLGYSPEEVLGADMHRLVHHHRADGSPYLSDECPLYHSVRTGERLRFHDEVLWRKDGSCFPVEYATSPVIRRGVIQGAVVAFSDLSALRQAEDALQARTRRQMLVAELGRRALAGTPVAELLDESVRLIRTMLQVEIVEVVELLAHGGAVLRAGAGWSPEVIGRAREGLGESGFARGISAVPLVAEDIRQEPRLAEARLLHEAGAASLVRVRIGGERPFGILGAASLRRRTFRAEEVGFLQALANELGAAIAREQTEHELKQLLRQQTAVAEFGFRALAGWDAAMLVHTACSLLRETLDLQYTSYLEILPSAEELVLRAGAGWSEELLNEAALPLEPDNHAGCTLLSGEPVIVGDLSTDARFREPDFLHQAGVVSAASVIVAGRDRPIGVLAAYSTVRHSFRQSEIDLLQSIANLLAQAIERRRTEELLRESEKQFRQAQKMEAVGRLAGGVAHDFNNLLTVIKGNAEMGLMEISQIDPLRESFEEIVRAANRAADLTRQLLAFSRRQVLQPKVLDLNLVVCSTERLLRRVMGEGVSLHMQLDPELGMIKADPGQIEQVLLNLAVNAHDAMPMGGTLQIETRNVEVSAENREDYPYYVPPGSYVQLSVSDNGVGMDEETLARLFEPFFTTKEPGRGTGLGLSTVYGIIKQSNGYVWARSRVGEGSTFHVILQRLSEETDAMARGAAATDGPNGLETVLLVEDESAVRNLTRRILERRGYTVLEAGDVDEAMRVCERHGGRIDLVLTDVILPGKSGRELVERFAAYSPETRVLYMSGYTDDVIAQHGVLEPGTRLLEKPFSPAVLLRRVREALDDTDPEAAE